MPEWTLVVPRREIAQLTTGRVFGCPHPRLAGHVLTYAAHDDPPAAATTWRIAPLGAVTVTLDLDPPSRTSAGALLPASPVLGLRSQPLSVTQEGGARGITIAFTPLGAYALGLPLRELANTCVAFTDLFGALLTERLAETRDWTSCFRLLDEELTNRLREGPQLARPVQAAWHRLTTSAGQVRIAALADEIGWTRQHLVTRFRDQLGLTPKTVARIARLQHAAALMTRPSPPPLSAIAAECGYADQSHFNRDFRALTGSSPAECQ